MKESEFCQEIIECIREKKDIEDETLFFILDRMSEQFLESQEDREWQNYYKLLYLLDKIWRYQQFETLTTEQSYLYGGIWGCLNMISFIRKKKETLKKCYALASKHEADAVFTFLNAINESPGLQNKKLALLCNISSEEISQISNEALKDELIFFRRFGKEKYYYLRKQGERVIDIVKKNKLGVKIMSGEEVYKMIQEISYTSDEELKEIFGTYEIDDIFLTNSLSELYGIWHGYVNG